MKRLFILLAVCILAGCTDKTKQAQECAQGFLDAFLANDFSNASAFCSEDFSADFKKAIDDFENLDDSVKMMLQQQCSMLKAKVNSVQRVNESDTFVVCYNIVKSVVDSVGNQTEEELIVSGLKVVDEKVVSLNK